MSNRSLHGTPAFLSATESQISVHCCFWFGTSHNGNAFWTIANLILRPFICTTDVSSRVSCAVLVITAHRCRCIMHWELRFNTFDLIRCDGATLSAGAAIDAEASRPLITGVFLHETDFAEKLRVWLSESRIITWIILNFKDSATLRFLTLGEGGSVWAELLFTLRC